VHLRLLTVGKVKEKYLQEGIADYLKRLKPMVKVTITEVSDEAVPEGAAEALVERALQREGEKIVAKIGEEDYVIALAIAGENFSSPGLAGKLADLAMTGKKEVIFVIGGSWGLSPAVLARANMSLSFGAMTFPHQLMRFVLLEQIYRAFKINRGEPYHK